VVKYILRRLLQMIPVIIGATFLLFVLVYALPGDPWVGRCGERPCSAAYIEKFKRDYNLDKPLLVQYGLYMSKLLRGDLGINFYGNSVSHELAIRYPTTTKLAIIALVFETIAGITLGVIAALRRGKWIDSFITVATLVIIAMPIFVVGVLLQFFILKAGLNNAIPVTAGGGTWRQLMLPGLVLGTTSVAYAARLTRTNLIENLRSDYVRTAKAKGLSARRTFGVHALRNSLIPVITFIGYDFGALMGGAIITESIFGINGIGSFIFRSIGQRDGVSITGAVTVLVLVYLLMNLLVDVLYGILDPRISNE